MPFYDFFCKGCKILVEDEFFKIADEKVVWCEECGKQMEQVILKAPGLSDPGGIGQKWTNDGYQMRDEKSGNLRNVTKKFEKGKQVI
jgi:putative FmdB family regulatory protein